jgi:ABC-2 type transport system permease protein
MIARGAMALSSNEARLLRRDPVPLFVSLAMPLLIMAFLKPAFRGSLVLDGHLGANGAEQAVPGVAVMFVFFLMTNLGFSMFSEHDWNTWSRLRVSGIGRAPILMGKACVPLLTALLQLAVLFVIGGIIFDLRITGSAWAIAAVAAAFASCVVALGLLLAVSLATMRQFTAAVNLGAVLFAGLGGALAPISALPGWAQSIAHVTPSYWAMRGFRSAILSSGGLSDVVLPIVVLAAMAMVFLVVACWRFDVTDTKAYRT